MTASEWLRPATAAERFDISERTLARWAADGLIGRAERGRAVWYSASDIADVIAAGATPRTVVPISATATAAPPADWESSPFWSKAR